MGTFRNNKGFSLIFLVLIMMILAGMGAAIYSITTSAAYTELTENNKNRAYQLAVAGMNYAAERFAAGVDLNHIDFKNKAYTLTNNRGSITYTVNIVTGAFNPYYDVISIGTVNDTDGLLLAKAQVRSSSVPNTPNYFGYGPPNNIIILSDTMNNTSGFLSQDLMDAGNHTMVSIQGYIATSGTHMYWAAFTDTGTYPVTDGDNAGCTMGFHTARINNNAASSLRQSWIGYGYVNYDAQAKAGWYVGLQAAVSGISFRWTETAQSSGLFQGYGLTFMRYTYSASGCGGGYDFIPNSIKPPGMANHLLLVLWEQRVEGGVERRRWLAYADLGTPVLWGGTRSGNDLKVLGAQDSTDGLLSDDSQVMVRVKDTYVAGQRVNDIMVFYADASPNFGVRTPNSVATDITRKRMSPQWVDPTLFPTWPTNKFGWFNYTDSGTPYTIYNYWFPDFMISTNPTYFDFFTLVSGSNYIGPEPPSTTPQLTPVKLILNPAYTDSRTDVSTPPGDNNLITLLPDKATVRTYKFALTDFPNWNQEVGLHAMGNLNSSNRVVAFDDFAIQILGR
jgi:hypothetical protein